MSRKRKQSMLTKTGRKYLLIDVLIVFTLLCFAIDFVVKYYLLQHTLWNTYIFIGICIDTVGKLILAVVPILRVMVKNRRSK